MIARAALLCLAILLLAPAGASAQTARERSLHGFLQTRFASIRTDYPETNYASAFADLNGDGRAEAIVYLSSAYFCGSGGCDIHVYTPARTGWRQVADISVGRTPVRLLRTGRRGWRDLGVFVAGGGIRPHEARLSFDGRAYHANPTVAPARRVPADTPGRVLIGLDTPGRRLY